MTIKLEKKKIFFILNYIRLTSRNNNNKKAQKRKVTEIKFEVKKAISNLQMQNTIITKKLARGCCMMYHFLISLRQFSLFFFFLNKKDQPSSLANSKQELGKEITQIAQSNSLGSFIMIRCQMFFLCKFYIYIIRTHPNLKRKKKKKPKSYSQC